MFVLPSQTSVPTTVRLNCLILIVSDILLTNKLSPPLYNFNKMSLRRNQLKKMTLDQIMTHL
jgi:hypothetical protein